MVLGRRVCYILRVVYISWLGQFPILYSTFLFLQDDTVMGTLTVRENLIFCAALRLPGHFTKKQRQRRVNDVIAELDLEDCADTKVFEIEG